MLRWYERVQRWIWPLGLLGMAGVAWHNWRLWQQDKALLAAKAQVPSLPPLESWSRLPKVSVLVAAWNEAVHIEKHIESFLALRYPAKELILCAGGTDNTYALACALAGGPVKVYQQQPGEGKQRALHRSLVHATGDPIFLTDADCRFDDDSFERTVYPVALGIEQVCTGSSIPYPEQWHNPFVAAQAASQLYASMHSAAYAPGLLGRNCAVRRSLLEQSEGLAAPAPTGTDYVLAKMLVRAGGRIRQVSESRVATDYPVTARGYVRQQRRWLRNVALYGRRFGAFEEVGASLKTSLTGVMMLALPLASLVAGSWLFVPWLLLLGHALLSRVRYLRFASGVWGRRLRKRFLAMQLPLLFLDFVAWIRPLFDYVSAAGQKEW